MWTVRAALVLLAVGAAASACRPLDMYDQAKYEPYEQSELFPDQRSARLPPPGAVPRSSDKHNAITMTNQDLAALQEEPMTILRRGQERYNIFCSPCHGAAGYGDGMIVQRGFTRPPSFHSERLRNLPAGYFYSITTAGFGAMPAYATQIPPKDRWAITAYIQALQLSQNVAVDTLPEALRQNLEKP